MDEVPNNGGGGGGQQNPPQPKPQDPPAAPPSADPPKKEGSHLDFYDQKEDDGKTPKGDPPPKVDPPAPTEPEKIENPSTGYSAEPKDDVVPGDKKPDEKPNPPADPPKDDLGFELKLEGFSDKGAAEIKAEVKELGLTKEQAEKYVTREKARLEAIVAKSTDAQKARAQAAVQQKKDWYNELRTDPTFGGQNFDRNLHKVEKMIAEFMPNSKKQLTDSKGMLRPSVMREFLAIADALYGNKSFVQGEGEPPAPPKEDKTKAKSPLDFYNS